MASLSCLWLHFRSARQPRRALSRCVVVAIARWLGGRRAQFATCWQCPALGVLALWWLVYILSLCCCWCCCRCRWTGTGRVAHVARVRAGWRRQRTSAAWPSGSDHRNGGVAAELGRDCPLRAGACARQRAHRLHQRFCTRARVHSVITRSHIGWLDLDARADQHPLRRQGASGCAAV